MKTFVRITALLGLLAAFTAPVHAQPARFVEGTHYDALDRPVRTADASKIEVAEVFWYGCGHCYSFEPLLENWSQKLPEDVQFVRSPGMWNDLMETHARIYYAAQELDVFEDIHSRAFTEIHQRGNYLQTKEEIAELFADAANVSEADFDKAWESFSVTSAVGRANTRMRDYGVRGVPSLIVNGKYRVSAGGAVSTQADMLAVVDFLVEQERKAN